MEIKSNNKNLDFLKENFPPIFWWIETNFFTAMLNPNKMGTENVYGTNFHAPGTNFYNVCIPMCSGKKNRKIKKESLDCKGLKVPKQGHEMKPNRTKDRIMYDPSV
jgi:hypothetical protein